MQLMATVEDPPIYREVTEWLNRQRHPESEPEPELRPSPWSRAYRRVTDWLKGPEAQSEEALAVCRPTHRRTTHA